MNSCLGSTSLKLALLLAHDISDEDADRETGTLVSMRELDRGASGLAKPVSSASSARVESFGDLRKRSSGRSCTPFSWSGESGSRDRRLGRERSLHLVDKKC